MEKKTNRWGWAFLIVASAMIMIFSFYPMFSALIMSFKTGSSANMKWASPWYNNYLRMFKDKTFITALKNTFLYLIIQVPVMLVLAILLAALAFAGFRYFHWFTPDFLDEVALNDPVIVSAVRKAARGGSITEELANELTELRLDAMPESWDDLNSLPALERIEIPQQALVVGGELPEGDYTIELSGGDGA